MRHSALIIVIALSSLLSSRSAQSSPGPASSDPQLTISTSNNQLSFRVGEIISLDLAFTSSSPNKYQMDMASYDRSGRLSEDRFVVDPSTGWDDPLQLYFSSHNGFMALGLRGFRALSTAPTTIHVELNEWIRFKTPGQYRVTVISGRVSEIASSSFGGLGVTSNSLTLTIVPATKEWQDSTLKTALQTLASSKPPANPAPNPSDPRTQAIETLRYLGTPDAAREMADRISGGNSDWDFEAGLMGSPARSAGLEEMKKLLVSPNFPVTGRFLGTMSVLALPEGASDNIPAQREKAEAEFRQELISVMKQKQGAALAVSNTTIVEDAAVHSSALPVDLKQTTTRQLVDTFDSLPYQQQDTMLEFRWSALDHEEMLPLIRRIARRDLGEVWSDKASAAALGRWYEMAPDEARPVVIQEILRPKPRFGARVLGILPDKELPEADQPLVEHLISSSDFFTSSNSASLIQRYGTRAVEPKVVAFLDPMVGKLPCAVQAPLLAYVLKTDPEVAKPLLERAMAARGKGFTACNHSLLPDVAASQNGSMPQDIAIKSLDDPDPQVVADAAEYLKQFGSASAEDVLWARLTAWSEHWKGSEKELQYVPGQNMGAMYESGAGSSMVDALAAGHGWLVDEAKLRRLVDLSIGPQQRQMAEHYQSIWSTRPWSIAFIPMVGHFQIAQYQESSMAAAKEKLLQFPHGSSFEWFGFGQAGEDKAFEEMSRFATEHNLKLVSKQVQKPN
jgi:hypothetical protein